MIIKEKEIKTNKVPQKYCQKIIEGLTEIGLTEQDANKYLKDKGVIW